MSGMIRLKGKVNILWNEYGAEFGYVSEKCPDAEICLTLDQLKEQLKGYDIKEIDNCNNCANFYYIQDSDSDGHILDEGYVCEKNKNGLKGFPFKIKAKCWESKEKQPEKKDEIKPPCKQCAVYNGFLIDEYGKYGGSFCSGCFDENFKRFKPTTLNIKIEKKDDIVEELKGLRRDLYRSKLHITLSCVIDILITHFEKKR